MSENERHLDIYENRYELHQDDETFVYYQGTTSKETQKRYLYIQRTLADGYLDEVFQSISNSEIDYSDLSPENQQLLKALINGLTSEQGRSLVSVTCLQLAIKSIAPEQCIRLHKGNNSKGKFSWVEGISMRTLDSHYIVPFLREHNLLNINSFGSFMTRSFAENYPYSGLYKAEIRGPFSEWLAIIDAIENETMPPKLGLCFLLTLLRNQSDDFKKRADEACQLTQNFKTEKFNKIKDIIVEFYNTTDYSARAFEVVMHGFFQAMSDLSLLEDDLTPLSQMRSANKKHGNIGDIELTEDGVIIEAWDAKYGKPYLRDELEEIRDKLLSHPDVKIAGFVCNDAVDLRPDIISRKNVIESETGTNLYLFSFDEWINFKVDLLDESTKDQLAYKWLVAIVESFAQKRTDLAPIDEPCDAWINDLISIMK